MPQFYYSDFLKGGSKSLNRLGKSKANAGKTFRPIKSEKFRKRSRFGKRRMRFRYNNADLKQFPIF